MAAGAGMVSENAARLAVLIDADNAQPTIIEELLAEVAKFGTAHVKRAYGDWTGTSLRGWKDQLLAQSIQPIQQFAYTKGKNATDTAMVIDAMDLLYSGRFDGFCIVSSDSDFTRLAARLRESGLTVYGFGERKTPKPFVAASRTSATPRPPPRRSARRRNQPRVPPPRSSRPIPRWLISCEMPWRRPPTMTAGPRWHPWATSSPTSARTSIPVPTGMPSSAI
jgi:NYN domain